MEFIIKAIGVILLNCFAFLTGYYLAKVRKNKKFQHPDEAPKVSTNEAQKEFCILPQGRDKCTYKSKDYFTCKLIRGCKYAK